VYRLTAGKKKKLQDYKPKNNYRTHPPTELYIYLSVMNPLILAEVSSTATPIYTDYYDMHAFPHHSKQQAGLQKHLLIF
jgi:hypothetical protein